MVSDNVWGERLLMTMPKVAFFSIVAGFTLMDWFWVYMQRGLLLMVIWAIVVGVISDRVWHDVGVFLFSVHYSVGECSYTLGCLFFWRWRAEGVRM